MNSLKFFNLRTLVKLNTALENLKIDLAELIAQNEQRPDDLTLAYINKKSAEIEIATIDRERFVKNNKVEY